MGNLVLNKNVIFSSDSFMPFLSSRAIDGNIDTLSRWIGICPGSMIVDLGDAYWIDRWVCYHMNSVGWDDRYCNLNYALYGSLDMKNWTLLDSVIRNTTSVTDRKIGLSQWRYVKLFSNEGLAINPALTGFVEFEVYEASIATLDNLTLSTGTLNPSFDANTFEYSITVNDTVSNITVTPTGSSDKIITVNGVVVSSGSASQSINLEMGVNTIGIYVTSTQSEIDVAYTITVNRVVNLYLEKIDLLYSGKGYSNIATITMNHDILEYSDSTSISAMRVGVIPYVEDDGVTIFVNGQEVSNATPSNSITFLGSELSIPITVTKQGYTVTRQYIIDIQRE
ncbi:cadherin-like beta sandwich domain-containing protein [Fusibacter sp. 3D3]|uniref:cadherin-like beta sandwich domain-containing protein n=1 Tax=Fusibacter sp. 3D3 TaxID=1048380 RepID=UPI0008536DE1|nr:cadherin-like beta sandwich domain-containing protein [Fusibacter sp. 3D3]GAU76216.1 hypothetical protein F3D3_0813 [Fusibacter sp. 3D3]